MTSRTLTRTTLPAASSSDAVHDIRLRTAAGTSAPHRDIPQLLAHIDTLQQRLETAEAALPGITRLTPGEPVELTIYRTEYEHSQLPLGLYTNRAAARAHAQDLRTREGLPAGAILTWIPDFGDDEAIEELAVFCPGPDDESVTDIWITVRTVLVDYDPEAEG
ncbi:hypothetical protein [Streptomyces sp. NPDC057695]|uniref:hypothetical protein n=1 Tax=Streptomyces sp. NPDC057695 TaxID=3346217 RepID=UPI0036CA9A9E